MLEAFERKYGDPNAEIPDIRNDPNELRKAFGGRIFGGGLYRIFTEGQGKTIQAEVDQAFSDLEWDLDCFASDWLGRVFALRLDTKDVVLLEPGTAEALEIECPIKEFHSNELVNYADAALAADFFLEWTGAANSIPKSNECIGYTIPLFLGGDDIVGNLELIDMDVYWTVTAPLIAKARHKLT